ncbi:MAG: hypothetical protein R3C05_31325 [Pirellulaceae bacterium]
MIRQCSYRLLKLATLAILTIAWAEAQDSSLRNNSGFGTSTGVPSTNLVPVPSTNPIRNNLQSPPYQQIPAPSLAPATTTAPPSVSLGQPSFDPYRQQSTTNPMSSIFGAPGYYPAQPTTPTGYPGTPLPYSNPVPPLSAPPVPQAASPYPPQTYSTPLGQPGTGYPSSVYPNTAPPALFPGGINSPTWNMPGFNNPFSQGWNPQSPLLVGGAGVTRLFQGPRLKHGWIQGDRTLDQELEVHESDISLAFAFPHFLGSSQPLYVLPSFGLTLFDGGGDETFYEAFLEAGWQSDPNYLWGVETGARVGVFSDFEDTNSDSLRVQGLLLGKMRLTPTATVKFGGAYIDRVERDFIFAGGVLWQPNPNQRWDLYFPEPKISGYFTTLGQHDVWTYIAGEFGGGSWTNSQWNGMQFDYRDVRVLVGFEWGRSGLISSGRRTGFVEAGYVFARKLIADGNIPTIFPDTSELNYDNSFILRAGIGY